MEPTDDELRARLRGIDPMPASVPVEPVSGERTRELMEQIMNTQPAPTTQQTRSNPWWKTPIAAAAAVAAIAMLGIGGVVAFNSPASTPTVMALDGNVAQDPMVAMCMQIDATTLDMFPIAFAGRAIEMEDGVATLEVTEWFRGGDADLVTIAAPPAQPALIGGVDIEVGGDYLITADNNTVSTCNFSDEASPELEALYREAFGS